jgi:hypothetical protein
MPDIDIDDFSAFALQQGLLFGINVHYLVAVAKQRSGIKDDKKNDSFGPYFIPQGDFDATRNDTEFSLSFQATDISVWRIQTKIFALRAAREFEDFVAQQGRNPSAIDLYLRQFPGSDAAALAGSLKDACDQTVDAVKGAAKNLLDTDVPIITDPSSPNVAGPAAAAVTGFDLSAIANTRKPVAQMILNAFAGAGFGKVQQVAALANAIRESKLNPKAISHPPEHSVGLFQLNMQRGLGRGHTEPELQDAATNISLIINEARKFPTFASASTLLDAVSVFVRKVERPANTVGEINTRLKIAESLVA